MTQATDARYREFLRPFVLTVIVGWSLVVAASAYFGAVHGDLTRVGRWPERDFGPRRPQLPIDVPANLKDPVTATMVVLGDSFSVDNAWQAELSRGGKQRVATFHWEDVGCLRGFVDPLEHATPGERRIVILQTAERLFVDRFDRVDSCPPKRWLPMPRQPHAEPVSLTRQLGLTVDGEHLVKTALNSLRLRLHPDDSFKESSAHNVKLADASRFSSRRPDRLLFFDEEDDKKVGWTAPAVARAVEHARAVQDELEAHGFRMWLMVIPDKSSVYRDLIRDDVDRSGIAAVEPALLARSVHTIELAARLRHARDKITDLYLPNDTHLGADGYRIVARSVAEHLAREEPPPADKSPASVLEQASAGPEAAPPPNAATLAPPAPIPAAPLTP